MTALVFLVLYLLTSIAAALFLGRFIRAANHATPPTPEPSTGTSLLRLENALKSGTEPVSPQSHSATDVSGNPDPLEIFTPSTAESVTVPGGQTCIVSPKTA